MGDSPENVVPITPDAETTLIDGTGKYLIPGLADIHVHLLHQEFMTALTQRLIGDRHLFLQYCPLLIVGW